jgi:transposase
MTRDEYFEIRKLHDEGLTVRAIARRLGVHRRKVRAALKSPIPPASSSTRRGSIIDPYRGWILAKLQQYPQLSASRIHQMLTEQGFSGSYTLVKEVVAELRPRVQTVYQSLDFAPGECAQVDWGVWDSVDVPGGRRRLSFFAMVLCDSRMLYAELTFGESLEFWLQAHRNAFEYFGGVPERVMVDNCKTAVIIPRRGQRQATLNLDYAAFARHYHFHVQPCAVRAPQQKGRVERAIRHIRDGFLAGREPAVPDAINPLLREWLDTIANTRVHKTTGERPIDAFNQREKAALQLLPTLPHSCSAITSVVANSCCRITVGDNRYSIPPSHARRRLILHRGVTFIRLLDPVDQRLIAQHPRSYARKQDIVDPDHQRALDQLTKRARVNRAITDFLKLGGDAHAYLLGLKAKHPNHRRHITEINALADIYGSDRLRRALADCHAHGVYAAAYIQSHLAAQEPRADPAPGPLHVTRNADLLQLELPEPDLDAYDPPDPENPTEPTP